MEMVLQQSFERPETVFLKVQNIKNLKDSQYNTLKVPYFFNNGKNLGKSFSALEK
ncbi:hypothetical protein ACVWYN_003201 [Pedobacter sp. UYP24]